MPSLRGACFFFQVYDVMNSIARTLEDTNKVATAMLRQRAGQCRWDVSMELEQCWLFFNLDEARTNFDDKQHHCNLKASQSFVFFLLDDC